MHAEYRHDSFVTMSTNCKVCGGSVDKNDENAVEIRQKRGAETIRNCAAIRGLSWSNDVKVADIFHECRKKNFTKRDRIEYESNTPPTKPKTRQESSASKTKDVSFDYRICCLFCCEVICERIYDVYDVMFDQSKRKIWKFHSSNQKFGLRLRFVVKSGVVTT